MKTRLYRLRITIDLALVYSIVEHEVAYFLHQLLQTVV